MDKKRTDRRIPKERRKRAAASCDHCKIKRNKCQRPEGSPEDSDQTTLTCKACQEAGIQCQYTIPRKRRVSSDVPGKRKYEYVEATFYKTNSEEDEEIDTPNKAVCKDLEPINEYSTANVNGQFGMENFYQYLQGPSPTSVTSVIPSVTGGAEAEAEAGDEAEGVKVRGPPTPPLYNPGGIPVFANKLRYIGLHGSYSFLVQVRSLFEESDGVEGHRQGPQTMGNDTKADNQATFGDIPLLPDRQLADSLVDQFFVTIHRDFPLFDRASFQLVYDQVWQPGAPSVGSSWLVCIYVVFVLSIEHSQFPPEVKTQFQSRYTKVIKNMMMEVISGTALVDVQAILLYVLYLFLSGERDASWNLLGTAARIAIGIGMHRGDAGFKLDPLERELRKRVWWTMYHFERMESSSLGRPSCMDDFDHTVDYPRDGYFTQDCFPAGLAHAQINLSGILGSISKRFYLLDAASTENLALANEFYERLLVWRDQLPYALRHGSGLTEPQYREMLMLHATYHYTVCYMMRPYLMYMASSHWSSGISQSDEAYIRQFSSQCASSALELKIYMHKLHSIGLFNHLTWLDFYFVYYTSLILCTQALVLAKQGKHSEFNSIKEHVISNDILFDSYPVKAPTMERFTTVAKQVSKILREVISKRLLEPSPLTDEFILATDASLWFAGVSAS